MTETLRCDWCEERILPGEKVAMVGVMDGGPPGEMGRLHRECAIRMMLGSLAHHERRCSCYGGDEEDPPGMTLREAAKAACDKWEQIEKQKLS